MLVVLWVNQCEQRGILVLISGSSDTRGQVREAVKVQYLLLFHLCSLSLLWNLFQIRKANIWELLVEKSGYYPVLNICVLEMCTLLA